MAVLPSELPTTVRLEEAIGAARSTAMLERFTKKEARKTLQAALSSYTSTHLVESDEVLAAMGIDRKAFSGESSRAPGFCDTMEAALGSKRLATKVLHSCTQNARKGGREVLDAVDQMWSTKHTTVTHAACPPIYGATLAKPSKCCEAGICICKGDGARLRRMRVAWGAQMLRRDFKPHSQGRKLLSDGALFLRLEAFDVVDVEKPAPDVPQCHWWHVSLMYWSPVRPTFTRMIAKREDVVSNEVVLEATDDVFTDYNGFERLHANLSWEGMWYRTKATIEPLIVLSPGVVTVVPWDTEPISFWPAALPSRKGGCGGRGRGSGAGVPAAVAGHIDEAVEPSDDDWLERMLEEACGEDSDFYNDEEPALDWLLRRLRESRVDAGAEAAHGPAAVSAPPGEVETGAAALEAIDFAPAPALAESSSSSNSSSSSTSSSGVSSSSSDESTSAAEDDAPPLPPPPAPPPVEKKKKAELMETLPEGHVLWYYATTKRFVAQCKHPAHGAKCFKTRTSVGAGEDRKGKNAQAQGRPLGHLMAWLADADDSVDQHDHVGHVPSLDARKAARVAFSALPFAADFFECERKVRDGEDDEPTEAP